jgi:hypothetical protein
MPRRLLAALVLPLLLTGCAGSAKLAQRGEEKLANGENGRAWDLAIRALKKDPGNVRARAVAASAGNSMARDWELRIQALAASDSVAAADQVLQLCAFRVDASPYAAITVSPSEMHVEQVLRTSAARQSYQHAVADLAAKRPKRAYNGFQDAQHYVENFRDAAKLSDRAMERSLTRVVVVPFSTAEGASALGRDVAASWRDQLANRIAPPDAHFTRILGSPAAEEQMTLAQADRVSRNDAIAIGRQAGAERVVWGSIGHVDSHTGMQFFTDVIARRIVEHAPDGSATTRWVDVPVEVIARVKTVNVDVDYEVIATKEGATLAHQSAKRSSSARVVWTSFSPDGDLDDYALVSDAVRAARPDRAKEVEAHWHAVCGDNTTLRQVLEARRSSHSSGQYQRESVLPRLIAGAAFTFLQELPPTEDLAFAALSPGWQPLHQDLLRLDAIDDVDLGMAAVGTPQH